MLNKEIRQGKATERDHTTIQCELSGPDTMPGYAIYTDILLWDMSGHGLTVVTYTFIYNGHSNIFI